MVRSGRADLALVFGRSGAAPYQAFREVAEERPVAVAGRDTGQVDQRIAVSSLQWKTDRPIAALALVKAGLGGGRGCQRARCARRCRPVSWARSRPPI